MPAHPAILPSAAMDDGGQTASTIAGPPYRVPCDRLPGPIPASLQAVVRQEGDWLVLTDDVPPKTFVELRNVAGNDADWQLTVDQLYARMEASKQSRASTFPPTMWGLLLSELGTGDETAWKRFMSLYRHPIRRVIGGMLHRTRRRGDAEQLTDDFFSWFFINRTYDRLVRVSGTGHVNRFRGFLSHVLKTFLRQTFGQQKATPVETLETPSDPELDPAHLVDRELIREAVTAELDTIRSYHRSVWRSLMHDFRGLTLEAVSLLLREEGHGRGGSVASVHRERSKARGILRQRLIRYRLRHGTVTEEEAVDEYLEMLPYVANAIVEYAAQHDVD